MARETALMDRLVALCKRRGFIFQSSEIYGGIGGFWDYGPLGVELKRNIKDAWWHDMVTNPAPGPDGQDVRMVGLDASIIMNPRVWEASGHVGGFSDPMVDCKECKARFRADQVWIVAWVDGPRWDAHFERHQHDSVTNTYDDVRAAMAEEAGWSTVPPEKREHFREILRIAKFKAAQYPPIYAKTVMASNWEEALEGTELSARERKVIGRPQAMDAISIIDYKQEFGICECPNCHAKGSMTEPREFNLMFKTYVGASEDSASQAYLRPETAQGIFVNFQNVVDTSRVKVPFGIAQIGKAFRNEINPRNFIFRSREFEQMEIEFFCHPDESMKWYEYWRDRRIRWYTELGIQSERLRPREQDEDERAHYAVGCTDIEYLFPFSDEHQELEGVAHRGDYDLKAHQKHSGKDLTYFDDEKKERYTPHVIEPSAGVDRFALATLCEAYTEDEAPDDKGNMKSRTVMKFHPRLAPIKAAVFPLVRKDGMPETARAIFADLRRHMPVFYDDKGAVGRRYRRQDEAGTPFCITVDGQTAEDGTVTVRDRDSLKQERIDKSRCLEYLRSHLAPAT